MFTVQKMQAFYKVYNFYCLTMPPNDYKKEKNPYFFVNQFSPGKRGLTAKLVA